ncbi:hypothetical protein F4810DRAFT_715320 [Camillea tinctor]|nr:hypothetical protein F4810DRAFT_715320 [Camillea tinctor]
MSGPDVADNIWVWAVDPDFDDRSPPSRGETVEEGDDTYKGYLRVRLPQLVNNFFEARRFMLEKYPMVTLWEAAVKSKNIAFVSAHF